MVGGLLAAVDDDVRRQPLPGDAVELADEAPRVSAAASLSAPA